MLHLIEIAYQGMLANVTQRRLSNDISYKNVCLLAGQLFCILIIYLVKKKKKRFKDYFFYLVSYSDIYVTHTWLKKIILGINFQM